MTSYLATTYMQTFNLKFITYFLLVVIFHLVSDISFSIEVYNKILFVDSCMQERHYATLVKSAYPDPLLDISLPQDAPQQPVRRLSHPVRASKLFSFSYLVGGLEGVLS